MMSSCNDDIYDNIKEFVDSETVYPAGYDQTKVSLMSGYGRVEIYLMGDNRVEKPHLAKAIKTMVKWGDGPNDFREFTPARSWVNVTGLTVAQVYHFEIYTEDEHGNTSAPVTISGKPFNEADKNAYVILTSATASASKVSIACATSDLYYFHSVKYSYTDKDDVARSVESESPNFTVRNLPAGSFTQVNLSYKILLDDVIDTLVIDDVLTVRTELTDPPPFNVVYQKYAGIRVSSTLNDNASFAGWRAVDGITADDNSRWASAATANEHWIEIDLQGTFEISALKLYRHLYGSDFMPKFSFQAWVGDAWVDVVTELNNTTDIIYNAAFPSVTTTKVRWYVPPYTGNRVRLYEIEVFGVVD